MVAITLRAPPPHVWGPSREWSLAYVCSLVGILKIAEIVLVLIAFLCSIGYQPGNYSGDGWVDFVTITGFIMAAVWFALHLLNVISSHIISRFVELAMYALWTLFLLIAGIVVAVHSNYTTIYTDTLGASAFFTFVSMALWAVDAVLQFLELRGSWPGSNAGPSAGGPAAASQQSTAPTPAPENPSSYPSVHY